MLRTPLCDVLGIEVPIILAPMGSASSAEFAAAASNEGALGSVGSLFRTNAAIKRMGAAKWKRLHSLAYVAGIGGVVHFAMSSIILTPTAIAFIVVLSVLLGFRVFITFRKRLRTPQPAAIA